MRYQICYTKGNQPLTVWTDDKENAGKMATALRKAGYLVSVWSHTKESARKTDL